MDTNQLPPSRRGGGRRGTRNGLATPLFCAYFAIRVIASPALSTVLLVASLAGSWALACHRAKLANGLFCAANALGVWYFAASHEWALLEQQIWFLAFSTYGLLRRAPPPE